MTSPLTELDTKVCNLVRVLRAQNGLSVKAMASYLSVNPQAYENMESGLKPFAAEHLIVLSKILSPENSGVLCDDIDFFRSYMALPDNGKRFMRMALKTQILKA